MQNNDLITDLSYLTPVGHCSVFYDSFILKTFSSELTGVDEAQLVAVVQERGHVLPAA